jgi:hypothetical protein
VCVLNGEQVMIVLGTALKIGNSARIEWSIVVPNCCEYIFVCGTSVGKVE